LVAVAGVDVGSSSGGHVDMVSRRVVGFIAASGLLGSEGLGGQNRNLEHL
jgi:hypothetical protein